MVTAGRPLPAAELAPGSTALSARLEQAHEEIAARLEELARSRDRLAATRRQIAVGRSEREILHDSALARALARLSSQAVIEQAKGILIAQRGCSADDAFDILRRASQRTNVPVRTLAAELVDRSAHRAQARHRPAGLPLD